MMTAKILEFKRKVLRSELEAAFDRMISSGPRVFEAIDVLLRRECEIITALLRLGWTIEEIYDYQAGIDFLVRNGGSVTMSDGSRLCYIADELRYEPPPAS